MVACRARSNSVKQNSFFLNVLFTTLWSLLKLNIWTKDIINLCDIWISRVYFSVFLLSFSFDWQHISKTHCIFTELLSRCNHCMQMFWNTGYFSHSTKYCRTLETRTNCKELSWKVPKNRRIADFPKCRHPFVINHWADAQQHEIYFLLFSFFSKRKKQSKCENNSTYYINNFDAAVRGVQQLP